jgi:hypothetical protein
VKDTHPASSAGPERVDGAGDETRIRDIQLGRNRLGIVFGSAGKWRLSTLRQLFAVSRIKPHVDDGAMGPVTGV